MHARLLCLLAVVLSGAQTEAQSRPSIRALRIDQPIAVDGALDDEPWSRAAIARVRSRFTFPARFSLIAAMNP